MNAQFLRFGLTLTVILSCIAFTMSPAQAMPPEDEFEGVPGVAQANVYLRAGPDVRFPTILTVRENEELSIYGCLEDLTWCEIEARGEHGWVRAPYLRAYPETGRRSHDRQVTILDEDHDGGLHIIIFQPTDYWDRYYRQKSFYKDRDTWMSIRNDGHNSHNYNHNDHNGYGHGSNPRPTPAPTPQKAPPKYQKMPDSKGYNPLCPMNNPHC